MILSAVVGFNRSLDGSKHNINAGILDGQRTYRFRGAGQISILVLLAVGCFCFFRPSDIAQAYDMLVSA